MTKNKSILRSRNFFYPYLAGALAAGLLFYIYYPTFVWMVDRWVAKDSYYSHGFLIPLVALFWLWKERSSFRPSADEPRGWAYALLLVGAALQVVSALLRIYFLSCVSFLVVLLALAQLRFGPQVFRRAW